MYISLEMGGMVGEGEGKGEGGVPRELVQNQGQIFQQ